MAHIVLDARIISSSTGRYVERLITYLEKIDTKNNYTILVLEKDKNYWKPTNNNFKIEIAPFKNYSLNEQIGFTSLLNKLKPDLVHFCMPQQPVAYKGKKVTTFHDLTLLKFYNSDKNWLMYHTKQFFGKSIFKNVIKNSDHIITVSNYTKKDVQAFCPVPDNKISVIYESSDVSNNKPKKLKIPFNEYLLYVGQQSDYKNIRRLGDAHQLLLAKHPNLGLVLVGSKNASALVNENYFKDRKYSKIHYTGFVSDEELKWLYQNATAYIFPSLSEGFGLPGLEAMENGLPVISSNKTCLPEIYGNAAVYFNPLDTSDIASVIDATISNKETLSNLTKAGYKQIKKYSWEKQAKETLKIYEKVLNSLDNLDI